MKRIVMATAVLAVATGPVCAQQSTAVGIGQAKSTSISASKATAVGVGGTAVGGGVGNTGTVNANRLLGIGWSAQYDQYGRTV